MQNPANSSNLDNGVLFIKFLWEECAVELEHLEQKDLDGIWKIIVKKSPRPKLWGNSSDRLSTESFTSKPEDKGHKL